MTWPLDLDLYSTNHMRKGKPYLGYSFTGKATAHWEWRDGESARYPPGLVPDGRCTVFSGGVEPGPVLENPCAEVDICKRHLVIYRVVRKPQLGR